MLTIMCGFPSSGKSTYLAKTCPHTPIDEVILCPDDFRLELTGQQYHGPAEDTVRSHVKIAARVLLKGDYDVVIDGTHLTRGSRKSWIRIAEESGVSVMCKWQNVSPQVARKRNKYGPVSQYVPVEKMNRIIQSFEPPSEEEGFIKVIRLCDE